MSDHYVLGSDARTPVPADLLEWARACEAPHQRARNGDMVPRPGDGWAQVANTKEAGWRVSTVFLGLDHAFGAQPPLLFETLIFSGPLDGEMERYSTWAEAEAGHARFVDKARAAQAARSEVAAAEGK